MFNHENYERFGESLQTSEEILYAIEQITENTNAYELWADGGRELEILAALPTQNGGRQIEDGTEVFWGGEGKFAEFDNGNWALTDFEYGGKRFHITLDDKSKEFCGHMLNTGKDSVLVEGKDVNGLLHDIENAIADYKESRES